MKRIVLIFVVIMMACAVYAQKLIVYSLMGKVEDVTTSNAKPVQLRDALSTNTVLNIPYHGCVVLYDTQESRQFTLKTPGRATIKDMMTNPQNSVRTLTGHYVSFIKKQISNGGQVLLRNCSDPATVTRNLMIASLDENEELLLCGTDGFSDKQNANKGQKEDPFKKDFQTWRKEMLQDYQNFRKKVLQDYADFVRGHWEQKKLLPKEDKPQDEKIEPIVIDENGGKTIVPNFDNKDNEKKQEPVISVLPLPQPLPTPEPVIPIKDNKNVKMKTHSFTFFGTDMKVRWPDDGAFHLDGFSEDAIANAVALLSDDKYENMLYDCLKLRDTHHLGDWAYYLMLKELSSSLCGKDSNEATLLHAILFAQSGYKLRLAKTGTKLLMLVATQFHLYGYSYYILDGHNYYLLNGDYDEVEICQAQFPKEQEMSLIIKDSPRFAVNNSNVRTFTSPYYKQLVAQVSVNKNLMDFYSTYPSSYFNNDFMTRWAMYANKEMQQEVREQLYPQLKDIIAGKSQREGAECILNWIQTSFRYEYDDVVWGHDRAFFSEESLYYPGCDCEDRSILFTRLIRDLIGLKCILVFYPRHLASGVCFTENVDGDYIDVEGRRFTICDPTIMGLGAPIGWTMRGMDNSKASVIVLE